ncbi:hypothetical protein CE195_13360 [Sodalis-like symbiont of Philaenus spumarius]|nr:hypothetical protein CE195_13360 [Sodalis-like symbiont of Philaenus spumarius]
MPLPEKLYYSLEEAAEKLACSTDDLMHYFVHGAINLLYAIEHETILIYHKGHAMGYEPKFDWVIYGDTFKLLCYANNRWQDYCYSNSLCSFRLKRLKKESNNNKEKKFTLNFEGLFEIGAGIPKFPYDVINRELEGAYLYVYFVIPYRGYIPRNISSLQLVPQYKQFILKDKLYIYRDVLTALLNNQPDRQPQVSTKTINKQAELIAQLIYLQFGEEALRNLAYHANPENKNPVVSEALTAAGFKPPAKGVIARWLQDANVNVNDIIAAAKDHPSRRK